MNTDEANEAGSSSQKSSQKDLLENMNQPQELENEKNARFELLRSDSIHGQGKDKRKRELKMQCLPLELLVRHLFLWTITYTGFLRLLAHK